ncbi:hypothetical protein TTHERM_00497080 (macronuclear) [Tetrahymena thermophila SB210]|uniref:Uncharacterized protein n=1 Tax=Tetrahymena thermophila (strain SB210) TaxID=312017 RepID=I7M4M0_TETTS|nr:hypothetical protein TTHERM_00497080 [Tetrahymena thermophila SB210]EAS07655.2 hypothetical protein TTHERM_00497080 [Tetrahymena thermophila SB210]|eukprot:XP_001027897.2 hypothetical protein TTHERM_00497080 [Tetrahymena thermophila SB210]
MNIIFVFLFAVCFGLENNFVYEWDSNNSFEIQNVVFQNIVQCNDDLVAFSANNSTSMSLHFLRNINGTLSQLSNFTYLFAKDFAVSNDCSLMAVIVNKSISIIQIKPQQYDLVELINIQSSQFIYANRFSCDNKQLFSIDILGQIIIYNLDFLSLKASQLQVEFSDSSYQNLTGYYFKCFSNHGIIQTLNNAIRIFQVDSQENQYILITDKAYFLETSMLSQVEITNDNNYLIIVNSNFEIKIGNLTQIKKFQNPKFLQYFSNGFQLTNMGQSQLLQIQVSKNNNYLFISVRSQGIQILEITDVNNPKLYQNLQIDNVQFQFVMTNQDKYGFIIGLKIIQTIIQKQILSDDLYPNLFNFHQVIKSYEGSTYLNRQQQCFVNQDSSLFYGILREQGIEQLAINQSYQYIFTFMYFPIQDILNYSISAFLLDEQKGQFFMSLQSDTENLLAVLNMTQFDNNNKIVVVNIPNNLTINQMALSHSKNNLAATYNKSVLIFDVSKPNNMVQLASIDLSNYVFQFCSSLIFAENDRYLLIVAKFQGLILLNIEDLSKFYLSEFYITHSAEDIITFSSNEKLAYFIDGFQGIKIVDLSQIPKIKVIGQIQEFQGWATHVMPISNDNFILVTYTHLEAINLFDIRDIQNPIFISQLQLDLTEYNCACVTTDEKTLYITTQNDIFSYSLYSQQKIHKQITIESTQYFASNQDFALQNQNVKFLIGQKASIKLNFIYPQLDTNIINLYYYKDYQISQLPGWINFLSNKQIIQINSIKDGVNAYSQNPSLNILILETQQFLTQENFVPIDQDIQLSDDQIGIIFNTLQNYNIINYNNYTDFEYYSQYFSQFKNQIAASQDFNGNQNLESIFLFVQNTLLKSKKYNPIYFYLQNSLSFNFENNQISTLSSTVTVSLTIDQVLGQLYMQDLHQFTIKNQQGGSILKLFGNVTNINSAFIQQQVIFIPNQQAPQRNIDDNKIIVDIFIDDNLNYPLKFQIDLNNASFIKILGPINVTESLQDQFDLVYQDSKIQVDSYIICSFKKTTFNDTQNLPITYQARYQQDNQREISIESSNWLQFVYEKADLRIQGQVPESLYWSDVKVTITAFNGYTQQSDSFIMKVRIISFLLLLKTFLQITSPIAFIFTLYQYRNIPYNIYYKQKLFYQKEVIQVNKEYIKKIPILNHDFRIARKIFKAYKQYIQENYIQQQQKQKKFQKEVKFKDKTSLDFEFYEQEQQKNYENDQVNDQVFQLERTFDIKTMNIDQDNNNDSQNSAQNIRFQKQIKSDVEQKRKSSSQSKKNKTLSSDSDSDEEEDLLTKMIQGQTRKRSAIIYTTNVQQFFKSQQNNSKLNKIIELLNGQQGKNIGEENQFLAYLSTNFVNKKGCLKTKNLFQDVLEAKLIFVHKRKKYKISQFQDELENQKSVLYTSLKSFFARYLLQKDKKAKIIYRFLKNQCKLSQQYTQRDWYKYLIEIRSTKETDINGQNIPFPRLYVKQKQIQRLFQQLGLLMNSTNEYNNENNYGINLYLVIEVIFSDALGLSVKNKNSFQPVSGESLHYTQFAITRVEALIQIKRSYCLRQRECIDKIYRAYGSSKNSLLPNWMNVSQKKNSIIISGVPKNQDVEEIVIRIYDRFDFIAIQYKLQIVNSDKKLSEQHKKKVLDQPQISTNKNMNSLRESFESESIQTDKQDSYQMHNNSNFKNIKTSEDLSKSSNQQELSEQIDQMKQCNNFQFIFTSLGYDGISILNTDQQYQPIQNITSSNTYVNGFDITPDCEYLAMNYKQNLTIFQLSKSSQKYIQISASQDQIPINVIDMAFNLNNSLIYLVGSQGNLQVFQFLSETAKINQVKFIFSSQTGYISALKVNFFSSYQNLIFLTTTYSGIYVFEQMLLLNNQNEQVFLFEIGSYKQMQNTILMTSDGQYLVLLNQWSGISILNISQLQQFQQNNQTCPFNTVITNWWPTSALNPSPIDGAISNKDQYLFVSARSQGIYIIDISDIQNPILFQHIDSDGSSTAILFSSQKNLIYLSNSISIKIYSQVSAYLSNQYPNLFNMHLGTEELASIPAQYKWRCYINSQSSNYYWGAFDDIGLVLAKINEDGYFQLSRINITNQINLHSFYVDSLLFDTSQQLLILPLVNFQQILGIYNISKIEEPTLISTVNSNYFARLEQLAFNSNKTLIAASFGQSILIFDISNINSPKVFNQIQLNTLILSQCSGIMFAQQDKYIIISSRGQGFMVFEFQSPQNITLVNQYLTHGGEDVRPLNNNNQYAFFIDGYNGVLIVDLQKLPDISIISTIQLEGWSNHVLQFGQTGYVIISTVDRGMIQLFDLSNKNEPLFISSYQKSNQNAYSTCKTSSDSYLFINNQFGVQTLPLKSDFFIHSSFSVLYSDSNQFHPISNFFEVGQNILLSLKFIYPQNGIQISEITYYFNDQVQSLPSWMDYSSTNSTINIQVSNQGLNSNDISLNTILIKSQLPVDDIIKQLCQKYFSTQNNLSQIILNFLINSGIIDKKYYLNVEDLQNGIKELQIQQNTLFQQLNIDNQLQISLLQKLKYALLKSVQFNPVYFYIKSSLFLNLNNTSGNVITTKSQSASIQIQANQTQGQFYVLDDSGVAITYFNNRSTIQLSGDTRLLNFILSEKKIIFINNTSEFDVDQIQLGISLQDNINNPINKFCSLQQATFISIKKPIFLAQTLQEVFEQYYSKGIIQVDSYLYIQFQTQIFQDPNNFQLQFSAQYETQNTPVEDIIGSGWLQFSYNSDSLKLQGLVPESLFLNEITITIQAYNGYQLLEGQFKMYVNAVSFTYLLNIFLKVVGPLAGVIGFYKYRHIPYNILYKHRLFSSIETIQVDQEYIKKFPLLNSDYRIAKKIFSQYKRHIIKIQESEHKQEQQKIKNEQLNNNKSFKALSNNSILSHQDKNMYTSAYMNKRKSIEDHSYFQKKQRRSIFSPNYHLSNSKNIDEIKEENSKNIDEIKEEGIYPNNPTEEVNESYSIKKETSFQNESKSVLNSKFKLAQSIRGINDFEIQKIEEVQDSFIQDVEAETRKISSGKREKTLSSDSSDEEVENNLDKLIDGVHKRRKMDTILNSQINNLSNQETQFQSFIKKYQQKELNEKSKYRTDFRDYVVRKFMRTNGKLRMHQIIEDIIQSNLQVSIKRKKVSILNYKDDLENQNSVLYVSLLSFFVRFLLSKNKPAKIVYKYIKKYCLKNNQYTQRDWYKAIVDIKATKETDKNGINVPFPHLSIKEEEFQKLLKKMSINRFSQHTYDTNNNLKINLYLVKEVLFADTLGLHTTNINSFQPTFGESIHFNSSQISSVEALIPIKHSKYLKIKQFLNLDNRQYGCSQNCKLPNWVNFNQKSNVIILHGIPLKHDVEDILIRIYDVDSFILLQYHLKIVNKNVDYQFNNQQSMIQINQTFNMLGSISQSKQFAPFNQRNKKYENSVIYQRTYDKNKYKTIKELLDDDENKDTLGISKNDDKSFNAMDQLEINTELEERNMNIPQFSKYLKESKFEMQNSKNHNQFMSFSK